MKTRSLLVLIAVSFSMFWPLFGRAAADLASDLPGLFDVVNVAPSDQLNIRSQPDARSAKLGAYAHDRKGIEVIRLSDDGKWGEVIWNGRNGWISMRFVRPAPDGGLGTIPPRLSCSGAEPFWALDLSPWSARFEPMDGGATSYDVTWSAKSANNAHGSYAFWLDSGRDRKIAVLTRQLCSDGMSDITYGWTVYLTDPFATRNEEKALLTGCCQIGTD